jgi:predicted phosphodiesterase
MTVRVIVPDSHGSLIDKAAAAAFLEDLKTLDPDEMVMLGDHVDCAGLYSTHGINSREDREYSYFEDIAAASDFFDKIQKHAPRAKIHYLEGNHEYRVKKWAAKNVPCDDDVGPFIAMNGPAGMLKLAERGIRYYDYDKKYMGFSIPNTIKLGKCFFTHGTTHAKSAAQVTLGQFSANVVFGHVHRAMALVTRTINADAIGAWCPGTLAQLQPIYFHSKPSEHTHGYGLQLVNTDGSFLHVNVPIVHGKSELRGLKGIKF